MSKEIKKISSEIMDQIHEGKIKMRSKAYFVIGSILTFIGLVASISISVFAIGAMRFFLRSNGILSHKIDRILSLFPWWLLILAIGGLILGIIFIKRYDFSYKFDIKIAVLLMILVVIMSGWVVDLLGFNDLLIRKGLIRGAMKNIQQEGLR